MMHCYRDKSCLSLQATKLLVGISAVPWLTLRRLPMLSNVPLNACCYDLVVFCLSEGSASALLNLNE